MSARGTRSAGRPAVPRRAPRRAGRAPGAPGPAAGFTLIEVLAATALFAVLGVMLFQVMRGATDLWTRGERVREGEERADAVFDLLAEDLRHLWPGLGGAPEQQARLLCGFRLVDADGDGADDGQATVLRFTRLLHEERSLPWLRRAGEHPAAEGVATLSGEAEDPAELLPTGGLAESLYTAVTLEGETLPSLVRRVRTPIGGSGSLLEPELVEREDDLLEDAVRLVDRVLHFGVVFWTPRTTTWDESGTVAGVGPSRTWDSTRGLVSPGDPDFPYGVGPASLLDGRDDLFPAVVRLELVLDPFEGDRLAPAALAEPASADATRLTLRSAGLRGDEREPDALWIAGEWVAVTGWSGRDVTVDRGRRGTAPRDHEAGTPVRAGTLYRRTLTIPAAREDFGR